MVAGWLTFAVIGLPWLGALIVWQAGDGRPRLQHGLAAGFSLAAGLAALILLPFATGAVAGRIPLGGIFGDLIFVPDGLGVFLAAVAAVIGCLAVIFSVDYMAGQAQLGRYYALVLLFVGGMAGLVLTASLLGLFFFWEVVALCSYALISFHNDDSRAVAGGAKALIVTQVGGVGLLAGALTIYAHLGSYAFETFLAQAHTLPPAALALVAWGFLLAAAAKSAQVLFHTWLPDAMEAPTPVSALIHAATMVNAGVYLLVRFYPALAAVPGWTVAVIAVGVLSALLGGMMALFAGDLKRVLAYSTISQLGYMVYAVGAGGLFAGQFHLLSHAVFKALLFLAAGAVIHAVGARDLAQMGGLGRRMPFVRAVFAIGGLALAGVPILNGFWSKELILEAGLAHGPLWAYGLALATAGLTALYTFRVAWLVFWGEPRGTPPAHDALPAMRVALALLALGTLTTWLLAGPFGRLLAVGAAGLDATAAPVDLDTFQIVVAVATAPATAAALAVTAAGLAAWWWRARLGRWAQAGPVQTLRRWAAADFGFEWLNRRLVWEVRRAATALRITQTGQLNWNVAGIVGGLAIVLAILAWGGVS